MHQISKLVPTVAPNGFLYDDKMSLFALLKLIISGIEIEIRSSRISYRMPLV